MAKTIKVLVTPDAKVTIEAEGFVGAECEKATKYLEEALGKTSGRKHKAEYRKTSVTSQQRVGG